MSTKPSTIIGAASSTHQPLMILSSSAAMLPASDGIHRSIWVGVADRGTRRTLVTGAVRVAGCSEGLILGSRTLVVPARDLFEPALPLGLLSLDACLMMSQQD